MQKLQNIQPILKWVGGKRQLLDTLKPLIPSHKYYCEPFFGGGALMLSVLPKKGLINDVNDELINVYKVIRDNVDELILDLKKHKNTPDYFYEIRGFDRDIKKYSKMSPIEKASRVIYLNKTCYNGLYRVNQQGQLNAPFGRYKNPNIVNEYGLLRLHEYLNWADIKMCNSDFEDVVNNIPSDGFVYFDPPYQPISSTSSFTGYTLGGFTENDQVRLKETCDMLTSKGIKFLLSNSDCEFIRNLYSNYKIFSVNAKRCINSRADKRGDIGEVLVMNYDI